MAFPLLDAAQRLFLAPRARKGGELDLGLLTRWQNTLASLTLGILRRVGGLRVRDLPRLPSRPGTLVVMNHQSLLDIAILVRSLPDCYPRIVTRRRYARGIPLISHSLRLYEHPLIEPGRVTAADLSRLAETARTSRTPFAIFPEGTRTRDGRIGKFRRGGLGTILEAREWDVYVIVGDGMWRCARMSDFVHTISSVEIRTLAEGPFRFRPGRDDTDGFVDGLRERMVAGLERLRADGGSPP